MSGTSSGEVRRARIIDGRALAGRVVRDTRAAVDEARARTGAAPGLAVILVGDHPASHIYVEAKLRTAREAGIETFAYRFDDIDEAGLVRRDWVKPGAVVIDVGISRATDPILGSRIVGDVAFDEVLAVAGAITPVPGGVGPMTVAMLMANTLELFLRAVDGRGRAAAGGPSSGAPEPGRRHAG